MKIILLPTNKRHKQLITQFGEEWNLINFQNVACFNGDKGYLIKSKNNEYQRWIKKEDFEKVK